MAPRTQKVTILESKMTSQGSKIDPQTTSGDQKVVPKQYFITDFQQRLTNIETDNITLTLRFTLHTIHVRLSNFALRTLHFTLPTRVPKTIFYRRLPATFNNYRNLPHNFNFTFYTSHIPRPTFKRRISHFVLYTSHLIHFTQHSPAVCAKRLNNLRELIETSA